MINLDCRVFLKLVFVVILKYLNLVLFGIFLVIKVFEVVSCVCRMIDLVVILFVIKFCFRYKEGELGL